MPLVTTVGGALSDSYVSRAEADAYFAADSHFLSASWLNLPLETKEAALRTAARQMERVGYLGRKAAQEQALQWPRTYRNLWFADTIPARVKQAQMEQAGHLARNCGATGSVQDQGVTSISLGELSVSYGGGAGGPQATSPVNAFCPEAQALLRGFWTVLGHVYAGDRESPAAYDFSCNPMDGQREYDYD